MNNKLSFQRNVAILGLLLFTGKLVAWGLTNSDAIFSDAMESIVNIIAGFMGLYSLYLASKPKDYDHPYGHGKIEFITAGIEGILIIFAGILIIIQSISSIINGNILNQLDWGIGITMSTAVINYVMGYISIQKGKQENSLVLISAGKHLQSDTFTTLGVLLSLIFVHFSKINWIDAVVAVFFGGYIIYIGWKIIREALKGIMDEKDEYLFSEFVSVLKKHREKEWIDIHNMKVQQFGSHLHIDAHITLPYYYSLREAHQEMEKVIKLLLNHTERSIEFNFHMDDCKPFSCEICQLDCPFRQKKFIKTIDWNTENMAQIPKHSVETTLISK